MKEIVQILNSITDEEWEAFIGMKTDEGKTVDQLLEELKNKAEAAKEINE